MTFEQPTYEEYQRATGFARFRYKYGLIVMILCWLSLLFLIYYMITNVEELAADPIKYGAEKQGLECHCIGKFSVNFFVNATDYWLPEPTRNEEWDYTGEYLDNFAKTLNITK